MDRWSLLLGRLPTDIRRLPTGPLLRRPTPLLSPTTVAGRRGAKRIRRGRQTHRHTFRSETLTVTTKSMDQH